MEAAVAVGGVVTAGVSQMSESAVGWSWRMRLMYPGGERVREVGVRVICIPKYDVALGVAVTSYTVSISVTRVLKTWSEQITRRSST